MIGMWMLRLFLATALIALAARVAEEAARGFGWPRRWVWAGAFVLAASLPWLGGLLPMPSLSEMLLDGLMPTVPAAPAAITADGTAFAGTSRSDPWGALLNAVLVGGWALASSAVALVFGSALYRARVARQHGSRMQQVDGVEVIRCASLGPATLGIVRPAIVLPRWVDGLPNAERALIVSHEREHAAARDPLLLAAGASVLVAAPWCLALWWMHRRLRDAAEADCDTRVLGHGADRLVYGRALLHAAGRPSGPTIRFATPLLGGVDVSRLERRIRLMTQQRPKHPVLRGLPLIAVAAVAAVVACDAANDAVGGPLDRSADAAANRAQRERAIVLREAAATNYELAERYHQRATQITAESGKPEQRISEIGSSETPVLVESGVVTADTGSQAAPPNAVSKAATTDAGSEAAASDTTVVVGAVDEIRQVQLRRRDEPVSDGSAGSDLVFYIDGKRVKDAASALDRLDPAEIESIDVFKGRAAAFYGADHAGGVVRIRTKENR